MDFPSRWLLRPLSGGVPLEKKPISYRYPKLPECEAVGVLTGPISGVWSGPVDGAPAVVACGGNLTGLWPAKARKCKAGTVVPVGGEGVSWVRGAPGDFELADPQRDLAAAGLGDTAAISRIAGKLGIDTTGGPTWDPDPWPEPPASIPWGTYLPPRLYGVVRSVCDATGADESVVGLTALGLAGAALSGRAEVVCADRDGRQVWSERNPALYVMGVLPSGARKSPIYDPLIEPWVQRGRRLAELDRLAHRDWQTEEEPDPDTEPVQRAILNANASPEALLEILGQQSTVLISSAEGGDFFKSVTRDGNTNIIPFLHAYVGEAYMGSARIGRKVRMLPGTVLRAAVVGLIQPTALEALTANREMIDQGMTARFLYAHGTGALTRSKATHHGSGWRDLLQELWDIPEVVRDINGLDKGNLTRIRLRTSDPLQDLHARLAADPRLGDLVTWARKAHGQAARIAGICAAVDGFREVPDDYTERAIELVERHLLAHAIHTWDLAQLPEGTDDARRMVDAAGDQSVWHVRELVAATTVTSWAKKRTDRALRILTQRGIARRSGSLVCFAPPC